MYLEDNHSNNEVLDRLRNCIIIYYYTEKVTCIYENMYVILLCLFGYFLIFIN